MECNEKTRCPQTSQGLRQLRHFPQWTHRTQNWENCKIDSIPVSLFMITIIMIIIRQQDPYHYYFTETRSFVCMTGRHHLNVMLSLNMWRSTRPSRKYTPAHVPIHKHKNTNTANLCTSQSTFEVILCFVCAKRANILFTTQRSWVGLGRLLLILWANERQICLYIWILFGAKDVVKKIIAMRAGSP